MRRLSLRKRKSKRGRRAQNTMTTPAQPDNTRNTRMSESLSYDSFSGSIEWSNEDISPNNNPDYDHPRSPHYQTPASALREESYRENHHSSPSIVDYYTDAWNRTTTFTPTNDDRIDHSSFKEPSGINYYYNNPGTRKNTRVSIVALAGNAITSVHKCTNFISLSLHANNFFPKYFRVNEAISV